MAGRHPKSRNAGSTLHHDRDTYYGFHVVVGRCFGVEAVWDWPGVMWLTHSRHRRRLLLLSPHFDTAWMDATRSVCVCGSSRL